MNRLKELRISNKKTQKEVSELLGVSKRTIINWENNETQIKPDKAQLLADFFGVPVGYLLGYEDTPDPLLNEIVSDLNRQLMKNEKEDLENHPELNEYYLNLAWDRMLEANRVPASNISEPILSTNIYQSIENVTNIETLDSLISDTLLANKLLDSLKDKLLASKIINPQEYNSEIEKVMSWLIDLNDALGKQKLSLITKNNEPQTNSETSQLSKY